MYEIGQKNKKFLIISLVFWNEIANYVNNDSVKLLSPEKICSCLLRRAAFLNELIR